MVIEGSNNLNVRRVVGNVELTGHGQPVFGSYNITITDRPIPTDQTIHGAVAI